MRAYLARGAWLWAGARLLASAAIALGRMDPLHLTLSTTMLIVAGTSALGVVDVYRRHERALLANLGVSRWLIAVIVAAPAIIGELAVAVGTSLAP